METSFSFFVQYKMLLTIIHVIGVVIGMGAAIMSDMLFSFYSQNKKLSHAEAYTLRLLSRVVWGGLLIIVISGIGLFLSDIPRYVESVKFLVKMTIMLVLLVNGYILHRYISKLMIKPGFLSDHAYTGMRKLAFACGAISVVSWFSLCILGVLSQVPLTYIMLLSLYILTIIAAIVIALIIERKTFE